MFSHQATTGGAEAVRAERRPRQCAGMMSADCGLRFLSRAISLAISLAIFLAVVVAAWLWLPGGLAGATQLGVSPVRVDVLAPATNGAVTLRNGGDSPLTLQVRLFGWHQPEGEDAYFRTQDVAASPPILQLPAGKAAVVRVVRLKKTPPRAEEAYRLIVDQLPNAAPQGKAHDEADEGGGIAISMLIRHSIPVFFASKDSRKAAPVWRLQQGDGQLRLDVVNQGDDHLKLSALGLSDARGAALSFGEGLIGYVLGHSSRTFVLNTEQTLAGPAVRLRANSNIGEIDVAIPVHE